MAKTRLKRDLQDQREKVAKGNLQGVVTMLNGQSESKEPLYTEARANLVALIEQWQAAHHTTSPSRYEQDMVVDFRRLFEKEKGIPYPNDAPLPRLPRLLEMKLPQGSPSLEVVQQNCKVLIGPVAAGANLNVFYQPSGPWSPWDLAWSQFLILLQSPIRERFGGPCRYCEKYFIAKTEKKQKVYCSRKCSGAYTAHERKMTLYNEDRDQKLATVRKAVARWEKLASQSRMRRSCKQYVLDRLPEVTSQFLSQAVRRGDLQLPSKEESNMTNVELITNPKKENR